MQVLHVLGAFSQGKDVQTKDGTTLANRTEQRGARCPLGLRSQIVCNCKSRVYQNPKTTAEKGRLRRDPHQALIRATVVYVPLVMRNVAK